MKNYYGYVRVSTPRQGRGVSLDEQKAAITAYASRHGLSVVDWFVETETAARQGRTQFTKLLAALQQGKAQGVIIHKIDRGARNLKDWANLGELIDRGLDVQFAHESLDLRSRGGRLAADIQAVVAADYIRNLRDEVRKGFYGRLKQGVYPLPAPVGYLDRGAGIPKAIDPVAAPLIRFAFERYAAQPLGVRKLSLELRRRGLITRRGQPISVPGLAKMLRNPFYISLIHIERTGETFRGNHEPLVSKALFDRVQAVMDGKAVCKAEIHAFRYRLVIRHPACSRHLTGERQKGRFVYYRCHGRECVAVCIAEPAVDQAVKNAIAGITWDEQDIQDFKEVLQQEAGTLEQEHQQFRSSLELRISACDTRLDRLTDGYLEAVVEKDDYERRKLALLTERQGLADQLRAADRSPGDDSLLEEFELQNIKLLQYDSLLDDEKRELVSALCSNVEAHGKEIAVRLHPLYAQVSELNAAYYGGPRAGDVRTVARELMGILTRYNSLQCPERPEVLRQPAEYDAAA